MAKYQQYEEYRLTGVSWIPEMPQGWQVTKLKYLIKNLESGVSVNAADYPKSEGEFGVLKTSCVYTREFRAEENKTVFKEELSRVKCPVRAGSIIISRMNTPDLVGAAVYVKEDYSNLYLPDRLWQTVYNDEEAQSSKYLHYFMYLKGFRDQISNFAEGASSSMQSIAKEDFLSINILLPTRDEQEGVANFLDHETAQIDTLIEKQQTLIQLLKEKRQAVISHAVTKGLNPDAPMKDSGVEWLGTVPEHWINIQLGRVCRQVSDGPHFSPTYVDEGVMFLSARNIGVDAWHLDDAKFISEKDYKDFCRRVVPEKGDILYTKGGTTGVARVVDLDQPFQVWVHVAVLKLRLNLINPNYAAFVLNSIGCYEQSQLYTRGATNQDLGLTRMVKIWFALPPIEEQNAIIDFIDQKVIKIDALINNAYKGINLLRERRTALISAAVTGKIDVRGWRAPDVETVL